VLALRGRQQRALLTTLLSSFGVPMLLGGDELGCTQRGNNNAYCQDGPLTRFDGEHVDEELFAFTHRLIAFRRAHPVFRRRRFLSGVDWQQLRWCTPAGTIVTAEEWADPGARSVAIYLDGVDMPDHAEDGAPVLDDDFLVLVNGWWEALEFVISRTPGRPGLGAGTGQFLPPRAFSVGPSIPHSFEPTAVGPSAKLGAGDSPTVNARSLVVLRGPVTGP
jgi:glycogen operon protein